MPGQSPQTGRAKAALVFGSGAEAKAVIATIVVQSRARGSGDRVRFTGRGTFKDQTARHIVDTVLPTVDRICSGVGLRRRRFEISVANTAATAAVDLGIAISGFSADVAILVAMLSAALGIPVPQDVVFTGHLASVEGQFALVKGIPAKLAAAVSDESIRVFIYPAFQTDGGQAAALAEARDGTRGGLRYVLDALTERFKAEQQVNHVRWVLKEALDPTDWPAKVAFTAALLQRLAPHLPADIRAMPPERLAKRYDLIAQAYVRSIDTVRVLLRALERLTE
jgi:hypothetical protein